MASISSELTDFLTRIHSGAQLSQDISSRSAGAIQDFYSYLHALGIEFCNFGSFETADTFGSAAKFAGSNMPDHWIEEYYARELYKVDYVLRRAEFLTPQAPYAVFDHGASLEGKLPDYFRSADEVLKGVGQIGYDDGIAIIGQSAVSQSSHSDRYFGFVFGGDRTSGSVARNRLDELKIAMFALLDVIKPKMDALLDGFEYNLTGRELDMLSGLAMGMSRELLSDRYKISTATVDMHLGNLRKKLNAQNLPEAVAKGYRYGILN